MTSPTDSSTRFSRTKVILGIVVFVATVYPAIASIGIEGIKSVFGHFANDSFYYLVIARNAVDGPISSFDGETLTNGYHPLWQFILIAVYRLLPATQTVQLLAAFWLGTLLVGVGVTLAALGVYERTKSAVIAIWLVPGMFHLFFDLSAIQTSDLGLTYTYSVWAFINGLESSLLVFFAGWLLHFLLTPGGADHSTLFGGSDVRKTLKLGILFALIVLTRLDDVFLLAAFFIVSVWRRESGRRALLDSILTCGPAAIMLLAYLVINHTVIGMPLPISAYIKRGFCFSLNTNTILGDFMPYLAGALTYWPWGWTLTLGRSPAILVPGVIAAIGLFLASRQKAAHRRMVPTTTLLIPLLLYVLLKALYGTATINIMHQGYWYYVFSILIVNVVLVLGVHAVLSMKLTQALRAAMVAVWILVFLFSSANAVHRITAENWWYDVWEQRHELRTALYQQDAAPKIVGSYDGLFAFTLDVPAASYTGLAADAEAYRALQNGRFRAHYISRGFDIFVFVPGKSYPPFLPADRLQEVYKNPKTGVTFARMRRLENLPR